MRLSTLDIHAPIESAAVNHFSVSSQPEFWTVRFTAANDEMSVVFFARSRAGLVQQRDALAAAVAAIDAQLAAGAPDPVFACDDTPVIA